MAEGRTAEGMGNLGLANLARRGNLGSHGHQPSQTPPLPLPLRQQDARVNFKHVCPACLVWAHLVLAMHLDYTQTLSLNLSIKEF